MALLPQDPKKQQILLVGLIPLLLFFAWYQFMRPGVATEIENLTTQVETLEVKNTTTRGLIAQLGGQGIQTQVDLVQEHIKLLEGLMPGSQDMAGLINRVNELINQSGLTMENFSPASEVIGEGGYYDKYVIDVRVSGGYHEIGRLLASIGSMDRIVTPVELNLTRAAPTTPNGEARVTATFKIQTFVVPPPQPVVAQGGPVGTP